MEIENKEDFFVQLEKHLKSIEDQGFQECLSLIIAVRELYFFLECYEGTGRIKE